MRQTGLCCGGGQGLEVGANRKRICLAEILRGMLDGFRHRAGGDGNAVRSRLQIVGDILRRRGTEADMRVGDQVRSEPFTEIAPCT